MITFNAGFLHPNCLGSCLEQNGTLADKKAPPGIFSFEMFLLFKSFPLKILYSSKKGIKGSFKIVSLAFGGHESHV